MQSGFWKRALPIALLILSFSAWSQAPPRSARKSVSSPHSPDPGSLSEGTYRSDSFGFTYQVPYGWVDRTRQMQDGADSEKSMLLLAAFERPPEAAGDTINSAVIFTAESVAAYPGLKSAADYLGPLTELTTGKGFKAVDEPGVIVVSGRDLVRAAFSKPVGSLTMRQTSLVMLDKGYIVTFTFISGDEDEADELIEHLAFRPARHRARRKPQ